MPKKLTKAIKKGSFFAPPPQVTRVRVWYPEPNPKMVTTTVRIMKAPKPKMITTSVLIGPEPPREEEWQRIMTFLSRTASWSPGLPHGNAAKRALAAMEAFEKVVPPAPR